MSFTINAMQAATPTLNGQNNLKGAEITCDDLKELFDQVAQEKNESTKNLKWLDDETVEVTNVSGSCMHQFALRAEELGKEISYEKKIYIKIKDK